VSTDTWLETLAGHCTLSHRQGVVVGARQETFRGETRLQVMGTAFVGLTPSANMLCSYARGSLSTISCDRCCIDRITLRPRYSSHSEPLAAL
jgi:hypothetical protein